MKLNNLIQKISETVFPHPSLFDLKSQFQEEFDIPECNIKVMKDENNSNKTGYLEIPRKDNLSEKSIERILTKVYSKFGFDIKTQSGRDSFYFCNNGGKEKYGIKIIGERASYFLDIDRVNLV